MPPLQQPPRRTNVRTGARRSCNSAPTIADSAVEIGRPRPRPLRHLHEVTERATQGRAKCEDAQGGVTSRQWMRDDREMA